MMSAWKKAIFGTRGLVPGAGALAVAGWLLVGPIGAVAADQPTLDDLLDLGSPEEQREALRDAAGQGVEDDAEAAPEEGAELDASLERMLEGGDPADIFQQAVREMSVVSQRLGGEFDPGIETQRMQRSIIDKLDQVIAAAQQQQSEASEDGGGGGEPSPQQADRGGQDPAQSQADASSGASEDAAAEGEQAHSGDASPGEAREGQTPEEALRELRQEWGNLPPRLRDEISEGMNERFSPVYRALTESYYRRLADEE